MLLQLEGRTLNNEHSRSEEQPESSFLTTLRWVFFSQVADPPGHVSVDYTKYSTIDH
jgi:hypothetical protein